MGQAGGGGAGVIDTWEALANAGIGLLVSWAATWWLLGYSPGDSVAVTAMFFGLSFTRSRLLRMAFRRMMANA